MNSLNEIVLFIKNLSKEINKTPTIKEFAQYYKVSPSFVYKFDSWTNLLKKAELKPNRITDLSDKQSLNWLKVHPSARYNEIPISIRKKLEKKYKNISKARKEAGLLIIDWRTSKKRKIKKQINSGRPIEFTEQKIIENLINLTTKLGRPPKTRDVTKKNCGFTIGTVIGRFGSLNKALQTASLPVIYSYQEINNLHKEFETLMVNVKIHIKDLPLEYYSDKKNPTFIYNDRCEVVKLKRSDIFLDLNNIIKHKKQFKEINVWFLVDDSLNENENINMLYIMSFLDKMNENLKYKIKQLHQKHDEVSRTYIGRLFYGL